MGNGKICDCCMEFTSLLQSSQFILLLDDGKRDQLNTWEDVNISREEIETVFLYLQSWTQRQCSCCFRDNKNFERCNWALQVLILVVVQILKHSSSCLASEPSTSENSPKVCNESENLESVPSEPRALWDIDDKEKLINFVSKVFQNNFPTYVAFKQHIQMKSEEVSHQEIQGLGQYCEITEPDASPYLYRNVTLFCKNGGLMALQNAVTNQTPETTPLHQLNMLVTLTASIKAWLNFPALLNFYVSFRSSVLLYLNKLVEADLKTSVARNMSEYMWTAVKDPVDAHLSFDKDGLDMAFKYFLSSTLTMRLAGVTQISNHINLLNELLNSEHILNADNLDQQLNSWLMENQILQHLFGPNLHVEVIKQSHTLLTYLAMEGKITTEHMDIMWQAAQLKHCSRTVYDVLSTLITNMEPELVLHVRNLLWKLEPKDHTEASLFLTSTLTKFMWNNAAAAILDSPLAVSTPIGKFRELGERSRLTELSSSENSVSIEASHSEDEIQPLQIPRAILGQRLMGDSDERIDVNPVCHIYKAGHLCKVVSNESSDEDSLSAGDSGKSDDQENVQVSSSGYIETHSDSDADGERSGNEETPKKSKRRVLRRKKGQAKLADGALEHEGMEDSPSVAAESVDIHEISTKEEESGAPVDSLTGNESKMDLSSGSGSAAELLEPNAVMTELSNLVHMADTSSVIQEFVSAPNILEASDGGSYSSRMSTKSEKNMADFDGEESICEEELMQSLTQTQLVELAVRNPVRIGGLGPVFGPRPIRPFNRRKRFFTAPGFNFQIDTVCQPGQTILWDLIQDDKITQLPDGLAIEAQKALTTLLCYNIDKRIKYKFIEGCIENVAQNRSIVVSLRLLPKLLSSYPQPRTTETFQLTLWADREYQMRDKFFHNLKVFKDDDLSKSPFPYQAHLQVRLEFLSVLFSALTSPEEFRLSIDHVDVLWECLATDQRSSDELYVWMCGQVRLREQHALSIEALRHIFIKKLPSLPPETVTMHALSLFQQLCSIARTSGEQDIEAAASSMDYLWKIALCATRTDVSMAAIQYLNGYYISRQLEKEDEFIQRCMSHIAEATQELTHCTPSDEAPLLRIQRALLLLKTHLEAFRRRYAYHLRRWYLEGKGVGSHAQLVGEKGAVPIKVVIQPAGYHEKVTLELQSTDFVADLRAEVAKWWETVQGNIAMEKTSATPVLGLLLTEGPIRMITQGIELSAEYDEKCISEVPIKDMQLVYVSMGVARAHKKKDAIEYSSSLPPPPRDKLPVTLLLQMQYFEQLFSLMQSLSAIKIADRTGGGAQPHTKAQVLSRRVWDILMLLPTNPAIHEGFTNSLSSEENSYKNLLDPASPQKLMYSLYIVEALVRISPNKCKEIGSNVPPNAECVAWRQHFIERGGLRHLFDIFASGVLESVDAGDWSEWKQDCLASLLKILCFLGIRSEDTECLNEQLYDVNEVPRKRAKRRKFSNDKSSIPRMNETMLSMMDVSLVMTRLTNILQACSLPRDPNHYKTGFWGRAQVVHYAMALLVCYAFSSDEVRSSLYSQKDFPHWLRSLVLEDPEPAVRREVCTGLYRLCLGVSSDGKTGTSYAPELISHLLLCLTASLTIKPQPKVEVQVSNMEEGKEPYGPACRDYFWLLGRLIDCLDEDFVKESIDNPDNCVIDLDGLAQTLSKAVLTRDYLETRHNTINDDGLVGLLTTSSVVMKHNPPFKSSKSGQEYLTQVFECLFALPTPLLRYLPKCKSQASRSAAFDLLTEMTRHAVQNYYLLQNLLMNQHQSTAHSPYSWDYWPHDDGRSSCGYVGLTNLGATCYMASCMQHLYMMPQARSSILSAKFCNESKHEQTLHELQRMFAYLMESERKAYNPRSFCKVYQMDHQPLNTGEQKDMAEFFIDVVSKLEEMTPELQKLVKTLFCGVTSNNVVSLDCPHVSRTLEEFYTVRCQVADMRTLYDSLNEVTVKDTLEGDNMYTCSQCGKKVRAEKRACFKKLPKILCFNTMRYTFNMITMMKEKVNTHFSFPLHLDMSGYVEKTLMPLQYQEEKQKKQLTKREGEDEQNCFGEVEEDDECYEYDLIGVTVHTGTADGGHYYSFIRDRVSPNKDKWYLFNDAEVKPFDHSQIAAECFGGEMNTKTYDSVTDKFMDFSFEKTNSAYMLFYEKCAPSSSMFVPGDGSLVPSLPGGSSHRQHPTQLVPVQTFDLSKELEDWIWQDNTQFLRDKNIFEHTYFNFMWQACGYIPQSLMAQEDVTLLAAKLSVTFFLETLIHAKEKPTMVQWVELLTKQLAASQTAAAWLLDHMAESDWWPVQILLKCPNQMVRQMFQRLCIHVIQQLRVRHAPMYLKLQEEKLSDHPNDVNLTEFGNFSCVTRFIKQLLLLLDRGAKCHLKHLTEYFTFLHDFSKLGDEECLFLVNMQAITAMVNFYLGNKKEDQVEHGSEDEEEEEEIVCIPAEKSKVASLEKMIALVATLVEKSRDESNALRLSTSDWNAIAGGGKNFPFILQQIRDGINFQSTRNLIFSLCRWNDKLAESIVAAIFQAIQKHPDNCHSFFKVLNLLAELTAIPPGLPSFTDLILRRILDVAELCPYPTLEWLATQVPRNKAVLSWCVDSMGTWVEHFLIGHTHQRVRNAAASLLVSLVPNQHFRQGYRSTKMYAGHHCRETVILPPEAMNSLHLIYMRLLSLLKPAKHYTDASTHGTSKLTSYFAVLTYFTISKQEKLMFGNHFMDLWNLFHPKLSEPGIACHHNKQALLLFWHHVCLDCPENIQRIVQHPLVTKHIGFNYILADHEDQEVVMFNRTMLPAYYSILRMCCTSSRLFASQLARHQNITWAFRNVSPFPTQYPAAVDELLKLMRIFATRPPDATDAEINDIIVFKRSTLQLYLQILDGRSNWTTLISAFRILIETYDDRVFVVCNNGINLLFEALHSLHTMHHEATACHVTGEIVELLTLLIEILRSFKPKDTGHAIQVFNANEIQIHRVISASKEWPEVLRKLATFLNTYNSGDVRGTAIETLTELLYIMPVDTLRTLVPLMIHCHSAYQDVQNSGMGPTLGPYFPKRSHHSGITIKPAVRPPRPMLQMAIPHINRDTSRVFKVADEEYDQQLREFYTPYHAFVDLMCRFGFMKDFVTQELVTMSTMIGYEAVPLRLIHFPKLWLEVHNTPSLDRKFVSMLVNTTYFSDYVELIMIQERTALTNVVTYNFLSSYIPKVYDQVAATPAIAKVVVAICNELRSLIVNQVVDIESLALSIFGDLKALTILYSPSINGKGHSNNPLPAPALTTQQLFLLLRNLYNYFQSLANTKNQSSKSGEAPTKKRKLSEKVEEAGERTNEHSELVASSKPVQTSSTSSMDTDGSSDQQKSYIDHDLIHMLMGTIDSLIRSIAPTGTEEIPEEEPDPASPFKNESEAKVGTSVEPTTAVPTTR